SHLSAPPHAKKVLQSRGCQIKNCASGPRFAGASIVDQRDSLRWWTIDLTLANLVGGSILRQFQCPVAMMNSEYDMTDLLTLVVTDRADALILHAGEPPVVHWHGEPHTVEGPAITPENADKLLRSVATTRQVRELREHGTAEFGYTFRDSTQFRV